MIFSYILTAMQIKLTETKSIVNEVLYTMLHLYHLMTKQYPSLFALMYLAWFLRIQSQTAVSDLRLCFHMCQTYYKYCQQLQQKPEWYKPIYIHFKAHSLRHISTEFSPDPVLLSSLEHFSEFCSLFWISVYWFGSRLPHSLTLFPAAAFLAKRFSER